MKTVTKLVDRSMFVFVWLTIATISTAFAAVFIVGLKTLLKI